MGGVYRFVPNFASIAGNRRGFIMRKPSFMSHQHQGILARLVAMSFLSLPVILCTPLPAQAATINVNTTVDDMTINGNCTLREAVQAANTNAAVDACPAGVTGLDTINIPAGTYTVTLPGIEDFNATGDFDIRETADFIGAGPATTIIDGGALDGVFGAGGGGGISHNSGTATISNSTISGNTASFRGGGIMNDSTLTVINSTITANNIQAGGPFGLPQNVAPMVIAASGGGIHNSPLRTTSLKNTIVANQIAGGDCFSPVTTTLTWTVTAAAA